MPPGGLSKCMERRAPRCWTWWARAWRCSTRSTWRPRCTAWPSCSRPARAARRVRSCTRTNSRRWWRPCSACWTASRRRPSPTRCGVRAVRLYGTFLRPPACMGSSPFFTFTPGPLLSCRGHAPMPGRPAAAGPAGCGRGAAGAGALAGGAPAALPSRPCSPPARAALAHAACGARLLPRQLHACMDCASCSRRTAGRAGAAVRPSCSRRAHASIACHRQPASPRYPRVERAPARAWRAR